MGSNAQVSNQINAFISLHIFDFNAFHALNSELNILSKLFDFTAMIFENEYYCNSIAPLFNANSIALVVEGCLIILLNWNSILHSPAYSSRMDCIRAQLDVILIFGAFRLTGLF